MAQYVLEILDGDRAGQTLAVADQAIRIGRKPSNDLVLADEKTSGVHAEVVLEGDRHVLRDLGSTNGTFLDGKRVTEIVLTPGDVVTIGRLRVKFRAEGEAPPDAGELAVRRLDAARLQRRGGSLGLVAVLLVVGLGAAGWFWWQGQQDGRGDGPAEVRRRAPLAVDGNRLQHDTAGCEQETGWNLRAAGSGFQPTADAHTGSGAFAARAADGDASGFALLRLAEPVTMRTARTLTVAAHVRTEQGGEAALRAVMAAPGEQVPFRFCTGTPVAAASGWQRLELTVTLPAGCDRLWAEVVAVLPAAGAVVLVDDVAVTEGGTTAVLEAKLAESGQTALGTGGAVAVRSVDADNPAILLQVAPAMVRAALQPLHRAGLCVLSDIGAAITCTPFDRGFRFQTTGTDGVELVFPAAAAGNLLVLADDSGFVSTAAESQFRAQAVLLGEHLTRVHVRLPAVADCRGRFADDRYRLAVPGDAFELWLDFRDERLRGGEQVQRAQRAHQAGRPGEALDLVRTVQRSLPMDSEVLAQATALRTSVLGEQAQALQQLQQDLDEASFFTTRGGFERVVAGVDELVARYGEHNVEDGAAVASLRAAAQGRLDALDGAERDAQRARLEQLATALSEAQQPGLAELVRTYIGKLGR